MKPALFKWGILEGRTMVDDSVPPTWKLQMPWKQPTVMTATNDPLSVTTYREMTFRRTCYKNGLPLYEAEPA